jgi:hypothetical protein
MVRLLPTGVAGTSGAEAAAARKALVSVRTDADGRFAVKTLPAGPVDLAVRARGASRLCSSACRTGRKGRQRGAPRSLTLVYGMA